MGRILIKPAAEEDLINIWVYIANDNLNAADNILNSAQDTFQMLLDMPESGVLYQSKRKSLEGIRFVPIKNYKNNVVYYQKIEDGIEIIRVLHARMKKEGRLLGSLSQ